MPPVSTRVQVLPFEALSWENFERLCHRLTALDADVEHCARYGRQGDAQEGIDIFARQADGRYHCLQAKRHRSFDAGKLRDAVDRFLAGSWAERAARFTIAVQASLRSPGVQEEIERQAARLSALSTHFVALDGEDLTDRLRDNPLLIDDFFGRPWVAVLLGQEVADKLGARLDGDAFARVREQITRVYEAQFQFVDPGSFGSIREEDGRPALTLLERFLKPDILVRETARPSERVDTVGADGERKPISAASTSLVGTGDGTRPGDSAGNSRMRRLPLVEWLGDGARLVLLGDAGCGKSTLLRVVALDLLQGQAHFPEIASRWGQHIPVYVPFARWSSQAARDGNPIGIKEIVRRSLEQLLTESIVDLLDRAIDERRVLLLVDGLDEWSNEQAARATLGALVTTVEAHGVPIIVSGRPRGLSRIGALPANWKRGTVAPLSVAQQAAIAGRWFGRYAADVSDRTGVSDASLNTGRFMAELARDANLSALAAVPLLLIGLVTLALRGRILPRTKGDIYDQLVRILLEVHPVSRATASGDTESRFRHATDPDQRRAAIARLAFEVRERAGGAGIPLSTAREILRLYLSSPLGFDLSDAAAVAASVEILSVNAETQGLIIEKAPGEVGFVHASFEEFLGAEHIGGWPFSEIEVFVRAHATNGRWRNVITNLLGTIQRRDEFDRLVAIIETHDSDDLAQFNRYALLGDIAFGAATRSPAIAKRLAVATMDRVESADWLPTRREALSSVLKGVLDPALKSEVEERLRRWLPARPSYSRAALINKFGAWHPSRSLQELLLQAMHDEERSVQRAAAAAYAEAFGHLPEALKRLLNSLACTRSLTMAVAQIESLALGWWEASEAALLFEEASRSTNAELRLVGILGLAAKGAADNNARDDVLRIHNVWSEASYEYRELAASMLMKYWPNDKTLVESALARVVERDFGSPWDLDTATAYLMESSVDQPDVRNWILVELGSDYPFNVMSDRHLWKQVGRFALVDAEIRAAANAYWCEPQNRLISMHKMPSYVALVADPPVAAALIEVLRDKTKGFGRHWALKCLLAGWGRDHPLVQSAIDALGDSADEDFGIFAALISQIVPDRAAARERLIRLGARQEVRRDLLAIGFEACGCDASDDEAVAAMLAFPEDLQGVFDASDVLFRTFGAHADVRRLALRRICEADAPLAAIAAGYLDDSQFAPALFDAALPLPTDLRAQIVEVAAIGATGTALETVLIQAMRETDPELRARMVIAYHQALPTNARNAALNTLLADVVTVGSEYDSVRPAALAGLVTIDALEVLARLEDRGKPVVLLTGRYGNGIAAIERLVCERFAEFQAVFGDSLPDRFESLGGGGLAAILSAAPGASPAARAAFLSLAENRKMPLTTYALRALAGERPRSELLLARCWDMLNSRNRDNYEAMNCGDVALILREHFPDNAEVRQGLVERFKRLRMTLTAAIPLAIFAPDAEELSFPIDLEALGREFGDWTLAVHVAACRADSAAFCELLEAMVTRHRRTLFDAQQITNLAVEERLQRDPALEDLLAARIRQEVDPDISGSFARYLATAGKLSPDARGNALDLLRALATNQRIPVAGYDAIADQQRSVRATLLDAVSTGLEIV